MKKNLLLIIFFFAALSIKAQVPNGGFENWTSGDPDNWLVLNIPQVVTTVTQTTPSQSGTWAAKGTVMNSSVGVMAPLIESIDQLGNGFAVTQAYSTLSFYYKTNLTGTDAFVALVTMADVNGNDVGLGVQIITANVSSFTQVNVPIMYLGSNPVECFIEFTIFDTSSTTQGNVGDYFIVDDVTLSGLASVNELTAPAFNIESVYPNPAYSSATVHYALDSKSDVEFRLVNIQGRTVREILLPGISAGRHKTQMDVANIPAGFYILRMKTNKGITFNRMQIAR